MTLDAIKAMRVPAADDCALWATAPMLPQALDVVAGWRNPDEINNRIGGTIALEVLLVCEPYF